MPQCTSMVGLKLVSQFKRSVCARIYVPIAAETGSGKPSAPAQKSHFVLVRFIRSENLFLELTTWSILTEGTWVTRSCRYPPWKLLTSRLGLVGFGMRLCTFSATLSSLVGSITLPGNGSVTTRPSERVRRVVGS